MENNSEIGDLAQVDGILSRMDDETLNRTLVWIVDKYGKHLVRCNRGEGEVSLLREAANHQRPLIDNSALNKFHGCSTLSDLLSKAGPETDSKRFLISAYWFTKGDSDASFISSDIVTPLRNAGYEIKRTSNALTSLKNMKPVAYVVQLSKNKGKSGHLTLKLTDAGVKAAQEMLQDDTDED